MEKTVWTVRGRHRWRQRETDTHREKNTDQQIGNRQMETDIGRNL